MHRIGSSALPLLCARAGLALAVAVAGQAVVLPAALAAANLTVSTTADIDPSAGACGDAGITTASSPLSLREATCLANNIGGDVTITVPAGTYDLSNGELRLGDEPGQNTTIAGAGAASTVIDAGGLSRVLELDFNLTGGVDTSISGLTLRGGNDGTFGGAGVIAGSGNSDIPDSLTIDNSTITGNQTSSAATYLPGGAVQFIGGSLTISNSTISNNSSGNSDGSAIFYQGQGIVAGERLTITGSTFTGNSTGASGAIVVDGGSAALHYNRLTGNTAASGSAVYSGVGAAVNATDNWWGCNTGPGTLGCDAVSGGPTVSPRLVLTASASPDAVIGPNGTSAITATLTQDSLGSSVDPAQLGAFDGLPVTWTDPQPTGATVSVASSNLSAGSATTTYQSNAAVGAGHVIATLDNGSATALVTVNRAPAVTVNPVDQTVGPGSSVSFTAAASGVPAPSVQWQRSTDGGGTFVPIAGATGSTYTFTATAGDDGNRYRAVFSNVAGTATTTAATLAVGSPPVFTSADHTSFVVGQAGSFAVTTTGAPSAALSRSGTQFPAWLTLTDNGDGTGSLTGTPPAGSAGSYQFTLQAANGFGAAQPQIFTLFVDGSPVITSADHSTFVTGSAGWFTVTTAAGFPTSTAITETGSLPSGVTLHDNGDGTAVLAGAPAAGTGGFYPITITAAATGGLAAPATQSFTLTVLAPPTITSADHASFSAGTAGSFTVTTTAGNPAATLLTKTGALPAGVTFTDNGDGTALIAGTPNAAVGGTYPLTITASNGITTDATQAFTLTVLAPPTITSADHATFTVGAAAAFTVTTAGGEPSTVTITKTGSLPPGITFTDNRDGTATLGGTPASGGSYTVTIRASNGVAPDATQAFRLTVNAPPSITSANHTTFAVGTSGTFRVTTAPGTPAATSITVKGSLPSGVTFTDNGDGTATLAGTPAAETGGAYSLTITASNGVLPNSTQAFGLTVTQPLAFTSANQATFTVGAAAVGTLWVTTTGFPTATTLTEAGPLPIGLAFTDNGDGTASISGTPAQGTGGTYRLMLTATNSVEHVDQAVVLTVIASPTITSANRTTFAVGVTGTFTVTTSGGFPAPPALTETGTLPSGVTFVDNGDGTATLFGTPTTGGAFSLTIGADNGAAPAVSQSFTLTVISPPVFTSRTSNTMAEFNNCGTFMVTATGPAAAGPIRIAESGTPPYGVTLQDNGDGTATLSGCVKATTSQSYLLTFTATNVAGTTTQKFTLLVQPPSSTLLTKTLPPSNGTLQGVPAQTTLGQLVIVSGSGYAPGTTIRIGYYPGAMLVASTTASATGTFSLGVRMNVRGKYTYVAAGAGSTGQTRYLEAATDTV